MELDGKSSDGSSVAESTLTVEQTHPCSFDRIASTGGDAPISAVADPVEIINRLKKIQQDLDSLRQQTVLKEWYSTADVAARIGRSEFTVREWCRHGRILADKKACGRGRTREWKISHAEFVRFQNEGLRPI